jgi:hypothetical protein
MRYVLLSFVIGVLLIVFELCLLAWMNGRPFIAADEAEGVAAMTPLCCSCMVTVAPNAGQGG